ncbi:MAG: hypothetical protein ACOH2H_14115 [Cypionkella sp.]
MLLFGKCLAMIAVVAALVADFFTFNSQALSHNVAADGLRALAFDASKGVALMWAKAAMEAIFVAQQQRLNLLAALVFADLLATGARYLHHALRLPMQALARRWIVWTMPIIKRWSRWLGVGMKPGGSHRLWT